MLRKIAVIAVALCVWSHVVLATDRTIGSDVGYGSLAVLTNLLYMPAKMVYAALGGLTGSLVYLVTIGNLDVAEAVWGPSLGGDYVVTSAMLRGDQPILFTGPSSLKD